MVLPELPEHKAPLVSPVPLALPVQPVPRERKAPLVHRAQPVRSVLLEQLVRSVHKALSALKVRPAPLVPWVPSDPLGRKGPQAHKVFLAVTASTSSLREEAELNVRWARSF